MSDKKEAKSKKVKMSLSKKEEERINRELERSDNFSISLMIGILMACFIVGIALGFVLYRLAIVGHL